MSSVRTSVEVLLNHVNKTDEEIFDYHNLHGFMTALTICPLELTEQARNEYILNGNEDLLEPSAISDLNELINSMQLEIDRNFNDENSNFSVFSEDDNNDGEVLTSWCVGFMAAQFLDAEAWFENNEQEVCELTLPIMLASGLFEDEQDFKDIRKDAQLTEHMYSQIPDVLMELYLLFNVPEKSSSTVL